jgi:hypothetical protein
MLQMNRCRHESAMWQFQWLFENFGAMPCSEPLDGVFAMLGLADVRSTGKTLFEIMNYDLTAWNSSESS